MKTKFINSYSNKRTRALGFVGVFAIIASLLLFRTFAAISQNAKVAEAEAFTNATSTTEVSDASSSGGAYVQFDTVSGGGGTTCNLNATTANFASQVNAATSGQTICLAAGNYGTWTGTDKAITIRSTSGTSASIAFDFSSGDKDFTLDSLQIAGGRIAGPGYTSTAPTRPQNITVKNSVFTSQVVIDYLQNGNILFDNNTHNNIDNNSNCIATPARFHFPYDQNVPTGVTIRNSIFTGGNTDGIQAGGGVTIISNTFSGVKEKSDSDCAHTDPIQLFGNGHTVRGNYITDSADGIVAYDRIGNSLIEHNVVDLKSGRFGIELYSDNGSTVRFNTLIYNSACASSGCGQIVLDHKSADPAGVNTIIENNVAAGISISNGSTAAVNRNNMLRSGASGQNFSGTPIFTGGTTLTSWANFKLASNSPGFTGATDGGTVGIR